MGFCLILMGKLGIFGDFSWVGAIRNFKMCLKVHFLSTVFRERSSRKTVNFEEQIMSKDKYLSIFLKSNGGYCVYYPSNIFRNTQDLPGQSVICQSCQSFSIGFQNFHVFQFRFRFSRKHMLEEKVHHFKGKI